jgi:uncharacterized protein (DUF924 family)
LSIAKTLPIKSGALNYLQLYLITPESANTIEYALRHKAVIERFGRFPHRNKILGRTNTAAEAEFLKQPGSSF